MISPSSTSIRPVTVAPSRISGGGWERPTLTSKVRVVGSAWAATSRTRPVALMLGSSVRKTSIIGIGRRGADHLRRHVEHRVTPALARQPDDHLAGLHDLARLGPDRGHHALGIRVQLGEADLVLGEPQLRLRRLDLRAGRLPRLRARARTPPAPRSRAPRAGAGAGTRSRPRWPGPGRPRGWPAPRAAR